MRPELVIVAGARPTWIKLLPIFLELKNQGVSFNIIHAGQHYDETMNDVFFKQLPLPTPDYNLGVGSGSPAYQVGQMMQGIEKVLLKDRPKMVLMSGDTNCVPATALATVKMLPRIPLIHFEAGLRSNDKEMPEEWNRIVGDACSQVLLATEPRAVNNLIMEGRRGKDIFLTGHTVADSLRICSSITFIDSVRIPNERYCLLTIHRPSNVNQVSNFKNLMEELGRSCYKIIFPAHPRTKKFIKDNNIIMPVNIELCEPMGYLSFISFIKSAVVVITDSGGIQEESTVLGVPCITLRNNTERPATVNFGTNYLHGTDYKNLNNIIYYIKKFLRIHPARGKMRPPLDKLWDGCAAQRVVDVIRNKIKSLK